LKLSHETWEPVFDGNDVNKIFNSYLNIFLRIYYLSTIDYVNHDILLPKLKF